MKIGQASDSSGVSQRMIRHYEKIGLIGAPARRDSGYREYSERDLHLLRFIGRARDLGFPIEEIRRLLTLWTDTNRSSSAVKQLALSRAAEIRERMAVLEGMYRILENLAESCQGDERPDCPILEELGTGRLSS